MAANARLATFCPLCEDAKAAFRKGPRADVTRVGQVVFDAESVLDREAPPPPYVEAMGASVEAGKEKQGEFRVDDDSEEEGEQGEVRRR